MVGVSCVSRSTPMLLLVCLINTPVWCWCYTPLVLRHLSRGKHILSTDILLGKHVTYFYLFFYSQQSPFVLLVLRWEAAGVSGGLSRYDTFMPRGPAHVDGSTCIILHRNRWIRLWQSLAGDRNEMSLCYSMYFLLKVFISVCWKTIMMCSCQNVFQRRRLWICIYTLQEDWSHSSCCWISLAARVQWWSVCVPLYHSGVF